MANSLMDDDATPMSAYYSLTDVNEAYYSAKERLLREQIALDKADEMLANASCRKEIKVEEIKIHNYEKDIKKEEGIIEEMRNTYNEQLKMLHNIEKENRRLAQDLEEFSKKGVPKKLPKQSKKLKEIIDKLRVLTETCRSPKEAEVYDVEDEVQILRQIKETSEELLQKILNEYESIKTPESIILKDKGPSLIELQVAAKRLMFLYENQESKNHELLKRLGRAGDKVKRRNRVKAAPNANKPKSNGDESSWQAIKEKIQVVLPASCSFMKQ